MKIESIPSESMISDSMPAPQEDSEDTFDQDRALIRSALNSFACPIPDVFWKKYLEFQRTKNFRFLVQINALALLAYLFFGIADSYVVPDVGELSLKIRFITCLVFSYVLFLVFKYCHRIEWLDLYLPFCGVLGTGLWFFLIAQSNHPNAQFYVYASVIFIVMANLGVQVRFLPSLFPTLLTIICTCYGVHVVSKDHTSLLFIFNFSYFPLVIFSLYISWNSTFKNRQSFLNAMLDESNRKALDQMAHTDVLTSLHNRRYFELLAEQHLVRSKEQHFPVYLLMLDIDHFKRINDNYGHDVGDEVLKFISNIIKRNIRQSDILARFGGEEFVILLSNIDIAQAEILTQHICDDIAQEPFSVNHYVQLQITCSIGFAKFLPHCHTLMSLIKASDLAMYIAKQQGRNRVVMHHNLT